MNSVVKLPERSLRDLLLGILDAAPELSVTGLQSDSRLVSAGDLFVALRGQTHDGHRYLAQAAAAGAVAALVEDTSLIGGAPLPVFVVPALRQRLGEIASRHFGYPSSSMHVAAVTGTNGKTTVSHLLAQLIRACGYDCGVLGTLGNSLDGRPQAATHTTPDAIALQACLAGWAAEAVPFVSMEASSHALDQWRLAGVEVDTAIFTNLTRDHLDYHGDMASYGDAKAALFGFPSLRNAIVNLDDPFSDVLLARLSGDIAVLGYSAEGRGELRFSNVVQDPSGLRFRFESQWGAATIRCPLLGGFNVSNLVAALGAALQAGLPFDGLSAACAGLSAVAGRMQPLRASGAPLVVIDYAHTPDALSHVLAALRGQCAGRLIAVFGCGGDRDRGKRALMADAVSAAADFAVVTSDNPRTEDPGAIIADVVAAMSGEYRICEDRAEAVASAIRGAQADDCVLIAGKGHEDYQIIGEERLPYSDYDVAAAAMTEYAA